jgi:hypothetical protein
VAGLGNSGVDNSGYIATEFVCWFGGRLVAFYISVIHKCKFVIVVRFIFVHTPITVINYALLTTGSILDIFSSFYLIS